MHRPCQKGRANTTMTSAFHTNLANMFLASLNVQFSIRTSNMEGNHELQREKPYAFFGRVKRIVFRNGRLKQTVNLVEVDQSNATIG